MLIDVKFKVVNYKNKFKQFFINENRISKAKVLKKQVSKV